MIVRLLPATFKFTATADVSPQRQKERSGPPSGSWPRLRVARCHVIDSEAELIQIDRLADDGDRAQACTLVGGSRGDGNDWNRGQRWIALLATIEILSAHARHIEIQQDHAGPWDDLQTIQRLHAIGRREHVVAFTYERL